jgi:SAM-dependent methyltransferase
MVKINFGCGWEQKLPGWINVDLNVKAFPDVRADLSKDLPFSSACADFIFTESFLEELDLAQGKRFLRECRRILKPTGVVRLLTADLEKFARTYLHEPEWLVETWGITVGVPLATQNACEVVNLGLRMGGQFFYDRRTFRQVAGECGFRVEEVVYKQSEYPELRDLDIRWPERSISMYFQCYPVP